MTEISRPWAGTTIGDAGPYSDEDWMEVWFSFVDALANSGVLLGELNDLAGSVVGPATTSPFRIATGRAFVQGSWYETDGNVDVVIPTPAANPRIDRIVLRKDFAAQTVRVTRIPGTEAGAPVAPAIIQVAGVTWDIPLFQVRIILSGAVVTIEVDERRWVGHIGAKVSQSGTQSIVTATFTAAQFNVEDFDPVGMADLVANNDRLTIRQDGKYLIIGGCEFQSATDVTYRSALLRINGATQIGTLWGVAAFNGQLMGITISTVEDLNRDDFIEFLMRQDSGAGLLTQLAFLTAMKIEHP